MYREKKKQNKVTIQSTCVSSCGDTYYLCVDKSGNRWEIGERYNRSRYGYNVKKAEFFDKKLGEILKFARCGSLNPEILAEKLNMEMGDLRWIMDHCRIYTTFTLFVSRSEFDPKAFMIVNGCVEIRKIGRSGMEEIPPRSFLYFDSQPKSDPTQQPPRFIGHCQNPGAVALTVKRIDNNTFLIGNIRKYKRSERWDDVRNPRSSERRLAIDAQLKDMEPDPSGGSIPFWDEYELDTWVSMLDSEFESESELKEFPPTGIDIIDKELDQGFMNSSACRRSERQKRINARSIRDMTVGFW